MSETPEGGYGVNNLQAAIAFSFFSIFTWVCSKILSEVLTINPYPANVENMELLIMPADGRWDLTRCLKS